MKVQGHPITDHRGDTLGMTSGPRPIQYGHPNGSASLEGEAPPCMEPGEWVLHSALSKVPADHPERPRWRGVFHALLAAQNAANELVDELREAGYEADDQPTMEEWLAAEDYYDILRERAE